ncbi:MAG: spore coat protein CotJB [Firmicutes bacterium]|jgi:spore coat protein JB|nr:spore coat protein CotJB [Bacillota bacterium]
MSREQLMRQIQQAGFALVDLNLFLDSHPQNQMALDYFTDVQKQYTQLQAEYEMMYGPLMAFDTNTEQGWTWIQAPWPWELEA